MKKILFAIFAVAALALTGCEKKDGLDIMSLDPNNYSKTEFKCWKFTVENGGVLDGVMYAWDTEYNLICTLQAIYKQSGNKAIVNYEPTPADDKEGCEAQNGF